MAQIIFNKIGESKMESKMEMLKINYNTEAFNIIQKGESIGFEANPNTSDEEFAKGVANFLLANVK